MADRSVLVRLKGDISDFNRAMLAASAEAKAFSGTLDTSTDRMGNLVQTSLALGPALVPIGAAAIPAISGLTNQLAFATVGAGVAALAFAGVGDALSATNAYAIEPTVANFEKMEQALATLGPAGREFVGFLQEIRPQLQGLQDAAQEGLFPGAEDGIRELMQLLPQAERIVTTVATTLGDLIAEAGDNLNDPRWREFFTFIENEARPTLEDMGRTLGNFAEGFANLWMAFDPLSDNFSRSFLQLSRDFAEWTDGLSQTQGFQEFVDYVTRVGPKAWDTLSALANALLQIVEAAAPVGEVMLPVITTLANVLASIADSPVGPALIGAAAGLSAISRAIALFGVANGSAFSTFLGNVRGAGPHLSVAAAGLGIFALSLTDLDEKLGVSNTATLALAGAVVGPWGAAVGAGIGLALDLSAANDESAAAFNRATDAVMNNSASLEEQAAAIQAARDSSGGGFQGEIDTLALGELEAKHQANAKAAQDAAFAEAGFGGALDGASASTREQTAALLENIAAHNALSDDLLASADAQIALEQAIDDASAAAERNGRNTDISTQAGRDNKKALLQLAGAWNNLSEDEQNAAGASESTRHQFIKSARQMGYTRAEAESLADQYLDIPTSVSTDVSVRDRASDPLRHIKAYIDSLHDKTVTIETIFRNTVINGTGNAGVFGLNKADGGFISGPGGPRDDQIPAMLSNGEFVVNAAATAKNLGLLYEINAQRFADGGYARAQRMADGGRATQAFGLPPTFDSRTLATALASATERAVTKSLQGATFVMAPDRTVRLKSMGG